MTRNVDIEDALLSGIAASPEMDAEAFIEAFYDAAYPPRKIWDPTARAYAPVAKRNPYATRCIKDVHKRMEKQYGS
jgi:hypothetical protein